MSTMVIDRFFELQVSSDTSRYDVMSFLLYLGDELTLRTFNLDPPFQPSGIVEVLIPSWG